MNMTSSTARWRAVVDRDQSVNSFVYAVRTTRIYCRPACPARLARRANIEFFDFPTQAEKAGYRSCKRCKPHLHVLVDPHVAIVRRACEMIIATASGQRPKLRELAAEADLTPSHFHRVFKKVVGVTPGQYARTLKAGGGGPADEGLSRVDGLGVDTPTTEDGVVGGGSVERSVVDWNEFDDMLAGVGGVGGTIGLGDGLQVSDHENVLDTNIEDFDPLCIRGCLSPDSHAPQLNFEEVLDISTSMTELLRGDNCPLPSNTSGELEQSTIPISPFPFEQSDMFWNEEGFSSYQ